VLFVRDLDALGWELHLRDPESGGNQTKYLSRGGNLFSSLPSWRAGLCEGYGGKRTQMKFEMRGGEDDWTPLHYAAFSGHLPVV